MRLFVPILLIVASIGLFVVYTNPTYQASKALSAKVTAYNDALDKSQNLRKLRDQLLAKRNTFSAADVQKIQEILPDNVDTIRLIIDISNIASRHGISLTNPQLGDLGANSNKNAVASQSNSGPVGTVSVGFSVNTSYDNMLSFIQDVEHSLRLIDVQKLTFTSSQTDNSTYAFTIKTYWLH